MKKDGTLILTSLLEDLVVRVFFFFFFLGGGGGFEGRHVGGESCPHGRVFHFLELVPGFWAGFYLGSQEDNHNCSLYLL